MIIQDLMTLWWVLRLTVVNEMRDNIGQLEDRPCAMVADAIYATVVS
jgi:hypothetical protein